MRALAAVILFENVGVMANFLENPLLRVVETRMQKIGQISAAISNWRHPQALLSQCASCIRAFTGRTTAFDGMNDQLGVPQGLGRGRKTVPEPSITSLEVGKPSLASAEERSTPQTAEGFRNGKSTLT